MLELYTAPTANCRRASIMLEEVGLPYAVKVVDIFAGEQLEPAFGALTPLNKCPVLIDSERPGAKPVTVFESLAILFHLAEKTGTLKPGSADELVRVLQWSSLVVSGLGAAHSGLFVFKTFAKEPIPFALEHYARDAYRHLGALEFRLAETPFLAGDAYSLADIVAYPTVMISEERLPQRLDAYPHLRAWCERIGARPAVKRGMSVPARSPEP